ncbi:MAG: hypothetical protein AAF961_19960, partial [Planctomycetota bacterium]
MANPPTLDDGLIGGWALFGEDEFATYGPNGIVGYGELHAYASDLTSATAADNLLLETGTSLLGATTVNSLTMYDAQIELADHTLVVESGGVMNRSFRFAEFNGPGRITAGTSAGAELLTFGNLLISADIVDSGAGAVGVTHSSGVLRLSGDNTFSGSLVVNRGESDARVELADRTALPAEADVVLNGGRLWIDFESDEPVELGNLVLRDSGEIVATSGAAPNLQPANVTVESGAFRIGLAGDAPIVKTSPLTADFSTSLLRHTGPVSIEEGILQVRLFGAAPLENANAFTVHRGGILRLEGDAEF